MAGACIKLNRDTIAVSKGMDLEITALLGVSLAWHLGFSKRSPYECVLPPQPNSSHKSRCRRKVPQCMSDSNDDAFDAHCNIRKDAPQLADGTRCSLDVQSVISMKFIRLMHLTLQICMASSVHICLVFTFPASSHVTFSARQSCQGPGMQVQPYVKPTMQVLRN